MSSLPPSSYATSAGPKRAPRPCLKHARTSPTPPSSPSPPSYSYSHSISTLPAPADRPPPPHPHSSSHVHFPPSQSLSTTFPTHSKKTYDRRPLVVAPNMCALPARGCPGRTYPPGAYIRHRGNMAPDDDSDMDINLDELLFAPPPWVDTKPATSSAQPPPSSQRALPPLMSDHGISSSESDESDGLTTHQGSTPYFGAPPEMTGRRQLDFLPHAPSRDQGRDRERDRERESRRRRRREREEEHGRWKTNGIVSRADDGGCLGGF